MYISFLDLTEEDSGDVAGNIMRGSALGSALTLYYYVCALGLCASQNNFTDSYCVCCDSLIQGQNKLRF